MKPQAGYNECLTFPRLESIDFLETIFWAKTLVDTWLPFQEKIMNLFRLSSFRWSGAEQSGEETRWIDRSLSVIIIHPLSKTRRVSRKMCVEMHCEFSYVKISFCARNLMNFRIWLFWRRKMKVEGARGRGRWKEGQGIVGKGARERRKERVPRVAAQKAFYAKYVVMVHLSQSVELFLNFHDLYFYILKTIHFCLYFIFLTYSYSSRNTVTSLACRNVNC